ncbi:hypothetical protein [Actinoplanes sp. NPDC089786]|uniref:hypothetical protein n=1 Tax=Actinoplanes sp. NPDC089786 TaxID=3155185 RepID=UPI00343C416A
MASFRRHESSLEERTLAFPTCTGSCRGHRGIQRMPASLGWKIPLPKGRSVPASYPSLQASV